MFHLYQERSRMSVNENEIKAAKEFLKSYGVCKQMLDADVLIDRVAAP